MIFSPDLFLTLWIVRSIRLRRVAKVFAWLVMAAMAVTALRGWLHLH